MTNMTKAIFQKKAKGVIDMGFTPTLHADGKKLILSFVGSNNQVSWERCCVASTYDVLANQEKKYLAWLAEVCCNALIEMKNEMEKNNDL